MKLHFHVGIAVLLVVSSAARASAQAGALDPAFGVNFGTVVTDISGAGSAANAMVIQADGKIVLFGSLYWPHDVALARYTPDGLLDGTFGGSGTVVKDFGLDESGYALGVQMVGSEEKLIAGGTSEYTDFLLARFNADGTLDTTFGTGGWTVVDFGAWENMHALAVFPDGKIVAVGDAYDNGDPATKADDFAGFALARFKADGTLDDSFGTGGKLLTSLPGETQPRAIAIQSDGKIVVAGFIWRGFGFTTDYLLVRYQPNGDLDPTFGIGGIASQDFGDWEDAYGMALQPDGRIVAAGYSGNDFAVARFDTGGLPDPTFGTAGQALTDFGGGRDIAFAMTIQTDGKIVAAGRTDPGGGTDDFALARYNADGTPDTTFDGDGKVVTDFTVPGSPGAAWSFADATAVATQADGKIVAAGYAWTGEGDSTDFALARYLGGGNTPLGTNVVVSVGDATLTFQNVTHTGDTTVTTSSTGPTPPDNFSLGDPATFFDIATTAFYSGPVEVCLNYGSISFVDEALLKLMHYENAAWVDATTSLDTINNIICGTVTSLSPFAIFEPSPVSAIAATVDVDPDVLNKSSKGSYITVYIEFPDGTANPASIDVSSIRLTTPTRTGAIAAAIIAATQDNDFDGIPELMVKFDRATVQAWFNAPMDAILRVSGQLLDGTEFEGEDIIRVIDQR